MTHTLTLYAVFAADTALLNDTGGPVSVADSFPTCGFFTVDFEYEDITWSIEGKSCIRLSALFDKLGITRSAAEAVKAEFTDPTLVETAALDGDWLLTSLLPFDTEETLKITFADSAALIIRVTDAKPTCLSQRCPYISNILIRY